jgi:hypothetical protein
VELEQAQRQGNWEVAARIQYGEMRDLKADRAGRASGARSDQIRQSMVKEEVTAEEIAEWSADGPACRSAGCWKANAKS